MTATGTPATESQFEATTIERLRALGYDYVPGNLLDRELKSVVLADRLRDHLAQRYPHLPARAVDEAVAAARNPDGVTLDQRNMNFHRLLTRGYELEYEAEGKDRYEHIYLVDWDNPDSNDFLVVNQLTVEGQNTRRPDISILDEEFLAGFKPGENADLQLKLLEKLLADEIRLRRRSNLAKYRSFQEMLEDALRRYHNGAIQAADVVRLMIEICQQITEDDRRKAELGLTEEELASYDTITYGDAADMINDIDFLAELVQEIVAAVKRNLKVDWTKAHRQDVYAGVQSAVKLVLRKRRIRGEQLQFILKRVLQQAEAGYEDWPMVA